MLLALIAIHINESWLIANPYYKTTKKRRVMDYNPNLPGMKYEFKDVHFSYDSDPTSEDAKKVICGLNLSIEPGSVVALVGRSGCGKTTLVNLMQRFYDIQQGTILVDGVDIKEWNIRSVRKQMGVVEQETHLFDQATLKQNLTYGLDPTQATDENLARAATLANADEVVNKLEEKYQTRFGEYGRNPAKFSAGEIQRLGLTRCFLRKTARILFLDEVTAALDADNEVLVQEGIDKLIDRSGRDGKGKCTVVLIAHRLSTVMNADKIVVIDAGKVIEEGTHIELVKKGGFYSKLVKKQVERLRATLQDDTQQHKLESAGDVIDELIDQEQEEENNNNNNDEQNNNEQKDEQKNEQTEEITND
eukprot:TRINITY_DN1603_c0_g2_i1.p2 TRINITY_DN1603_c0_g2~~TRINITY_DN1603_c0_g2_i1.p2  ORF type:complete len:362 (-),score=100.79 TRINITY_DN1603_c0_g2_i1:95-1180(-)